MRKLLDKIGLFITNVVRSLDNVQGSGYSGRKLTAVFCVVYAARLADKLEGVYRLYASIAFLVVALLCLGIVTVEQIIKFKAGLDPEKKTDTQG